jgi:hypothetical protein
MMCLDDEIRHRHHRQSSRLSDDKSDDAMEERDTYSHTPLLQDTWKSRNHGRNCRNARPKPPDGPAITASSKKGGRAKVAQELQNNNPQEN